MTETITVAHSPDLDDVFMFWAIRSGVLETPGRRYELIPGDIEVLNRDARDGRYDVTAISFGAYPHLAERYDLLTSGASVGEGYGPVVVAKRPMSADDLTGRTIAIPGLLTTAYLVLRLAIPGVKPLELPFKTVGTAVLDGRADAGVLIHEGQLTWKALGLEKVLDLGEWWKEKTGAALALGGNAIRRSFAAEKKQAIARDLKRSIEIGLEHRDRALRESLEITKSLDFAAGQRYLDMYVSRETVELSPAVRRALFDLYARAQKSGLIPGGFTPTLIDA